ncbi:electron transfer flavoprotein subunit beta/FixA family protein [Chloroflexota bacterium]
MNIIVCLKQVPDTTSVKIDPQTNTLVRQGIKNIINPLDTYALEEAVRLREKHGGRVTALSMGPPQAEEMLREAISLGADEAILLSDRAFAGADTWATARTLAAAMKKIEHDLIICGRQTLDGDTGQVAPELAEMLQLPFIAYVSKIEGINEGQLRTQRMVEEGHEVLETTLPAVITVVKEINEPRLPSLRGVMKSKSAAIPAWTVSNLGLDPATVGLQGSFTQVTRVFFPRRTCQAEIFQGDPGTQVDCLVSKLKDNVII